MTDHIAEEDAAGLALLEPGDPQRVLAEEHAAGCAACRERLATAGATMGALKLLAPVRAPDLRTLAAVRAEIESLTTRRSPFGWIAVAVVALASIGLALFDLGEGGVAFGPKCLAIELAAAVAPAAVALFLARRGIMSVMSVSAAAMAGAFAGQCFLHFSCPAHDAHHLFVFHVAGVAAAGLLAFAAGHAVTRPARATA